MLICTQLVQIGRIFIDPSKRTGQSGQETKRQLKNAMPVTMNRFHEALDELEDELVNNRNNQSM